MNRFDRLFEKKKEGLLNIYFTAGHPVLDSIQEIIECLSKYGADIIEIGMPYSDPMADGKTIQDSSQIALKNGFTLVYLFDQIKSVRTTVKDTPLILMGYYNQMLQYGIDKFLKTAADVGVDGLIIPDLPMKVYKNHIQEKLKQHNLRISFLITPQTSDERIYQSDELSDSFIYVVSQSSITGSKGSISAEQLTYFKRLTDMKLNTPKLIGFGIHDHESFTNACEHANGAIIGSAFIRHLDKNGHTEQSISTFIDYILNPI